MNLSEVLEVNMFYSYTKLSLAIIQVGDEPVSTRFAESAVKVTANGGYEAEMLK